MIKNETFIAEDDIIQTLPDGRTIQLAAKGVEIPLAVARTMGLVKDGASGPSEFKDSSEREAYLAERALAQRQATQVDTGTAIGTVASDVSVQRDAAQQTAVHQTDDAARAIRSPKRPNG